MRALWTGGFVLWRDRVRRARSRVETVQRDRQGPCWPQGDNGRVGSLIAKIHSLLTSAYCLMPVAFLMNLPYFTRNNFGWVSCFGHISDSASSPGLGLLAGFVLNRVRNV